MIVPIMLFLLVLFVLTEGNALVAVLFVMSLIWALGQKEKPPESD